MLANKTGAILWLARSVAPGRLNNGRHKRRPFGRLFSVFSSLLTVLGGTLFALLLYLKFC